jgi:PAS domain-containing protein
LRGRLTVTWSRPICDYRWTAARAVPILDEDGHIREWIGTNTDVTERVSAEEALRDSEARFRQLQFHAANRLGRPTGRLHRLLQRPLV